MEAIQLEERFYEAMAPFEMEPERKLMLRILQSAIADYYDNPFDIAHTKKGQRQMYKRDAYYWIFDEPMAYGGIHSFDSICFYLGLDSRRMRAAIRDRTLTPTVTNNILQEYKKGKR